MPELRFASFVLAALVAACQPMKQAAHVPEATGFVTEAAPPPTSALVDDNGVARDDYGRPFTSALLNKPLPFFTGETVSGETFDSSRLARWTILDVWGLWCSDCMADAPFVAKLAAQADANDLDFMSLHVPAGEHRITPEEMFMKYGSVPAYFEQAGYSYPTLVDTDASIRNLLNIDWTPTYLLVSPDGIVRGFRTDLSAAGDTPVEDFFADIADLKAGVEGDAETLIASAKIGPEGTINLRGETIFALPNIQAGFPEFQVISDRADTGDEATPVFRILPPLVSPSETPLYTVWPDWQRGKVLAVSTRHPSVPGPNGETVGQTRFTDIFPGTGEDTDFLIQDHCSTAFVTDRPALACIPPEGDGRFVLLFPADTESAADSQLLEMTFLPEIKTDETGGD